MIITPEQCDLMVSKLKLCSDSNPAHSVSKFAEVATSGNGLRWNYAFFGLSLLKKITIIFIIITTIVIIIIVGIIAINLHLNWFFYKQWLSNAKINKKSIKIKNLLKYTGCNLKKRFLPTVPENFIKILPKKLS